MARAYGSSAHLLMKRETAYGQAATGDYVRMPFSLASARGYDLAVFSELLPAAEAGLVDALCSDRLRDDGP